MYQAVQNGSFGFGAICGASFGGSIADTIGWRWCFLLQVPVSAVAMALGYLVVRNPRTSLHGASFRETWRAVDFSGAFLLVTAISVQLIGLSMGGNELPWDSPWVIACLAGSTVLFAVFLYVEGRTSAIPVIPLRMLKGRLPTLTQITNVCVGLSAYAVSGSGCLDGLGPWLTRRLVPFHAATVLSGRPPRLRHHGRGPSRHPLVSNPDRGFDCGSGHVAIREACHTCPRRGFPYGPWKRLGDHAAV